MSTASKTTKDHEIIRDWVEKRGGKPAVVKGVTRGLLRIDFPGYGNDDALEEISWDEFFKIFDEKNLELLYQEKTIEGEMSRFNKFVNPK